MMKNVKTVGCLLLLCAIICGCAVMGMQAETLPPEGNMEPAGESTDSVKETESPAPPASGTSTTVEKTYSEGLKFRSNGDGTCSLAGIGSCTAACVLIPPRSPAGDTVTEILPFALSGSIVGAIEIPATLTTVSAASFAGCTRLSFVRVAAGNKALSECDGVLYTADGGTLLFCPANRTVPTLRLHRSLSRVAAGAFAGCHGLENVIFYGNTAKWQAVIVGDDDDALYAAGFKFEE